MAEHNQTGKLGENIAKKYLINQGFTVLDANYRKKWGELDLVVKKRDTIHFVEVKTVSYETKPQVKDAISNPIFAPEKRIDSDKLSKLSKVVETWCAEQRYVGEVQLDVVTVRMVKRLKYAAVEYIPNVSM